MTDDTIPPEFADQPVIDLGEISVEDAEAAAEALTRAIQTKKCETLRENFKTGKLSDTLKRGIMGLIRHYAEHGDNGGEIARLIRKSGIINDIPVMVDPSVNWGDVTH
jgi:ATP phosphoribosyltransferase regulatory subunit HisZ